MNKRAFTLAEVLITLGIIGVVAALTIPTLIQNTQEKSTVTALKKAYSILSQAYTMAENQNGTPESWDLIGNESGPGAINMLNILAPYLKITKMCGAGTGCFSPDMYTLLSPADDIKYDGSSLFATAQLADGSLLAVTIRDKDCLQVRGTSQALQNTCALIMVDVNGPKKPNKNGVDSFWFDVTKFGIIPQGTEPDTLRPFASDCKDKSSASGFGCAAWVIYNENMGYLKCSDLAWDGKHKCG